MALSVSTGSMNLNLISNNNSLNKIVVVDTLGELYWRDATTLPSSSQGPTGSTGPTGPVGTNGTNGAQGQIGPTGPAGLGSGDVIGPASSTNRALPLFNGITGKLIMNSGIVTDSTSQGLIFSNSGITTSDDQLDYYELNEFTMSFQSTGGGGVILNALPMRIFRMGKLIMCEIGTQTANLIFTGALQSTTPLSARYLPASQTTLYGLSVVNDSAQMMGYLNITPAGFLQIGPLASATVIALASFQGSGGVGTKICGTWQNSHVSWMLV